MNKKKTLVLGASNNPMRYAYKAIYSLKDKGHDVVALGKTGGEVLNVPIQKSINELSDIDTVTVYLNPSNQIDYYDFLIQLKPKRVIFNPGTENALLAENLKDHDIEPIFACTLVMLNTGQY